MDKIGSIGNWDLVFNREEEVDELKAMIKVSFREMGELINPVYLNTELIFIGVVILNILTILLIVIACK